MSQHGLAGEPRVHLLEQELAVRVTIFVDMHVAVDGDVERVVLRRLAAPRVHVAARVADAEGQRGGHADGRHERDERQRAEAAQRQRMEEMEHEFTQRQAALQLQLATKQALATKLSPANSPRPGLDRRGTEAVLGDLKSEFQLESKLQNKLAGIAEDADGEDGGSAVESPAVVALVAEAARPTTGTRAYVYMCTCLCMRVCVYVHVYMRAYAHACLHTHEHAVGLLVCAHTYAPHRRTTACVCTYVCTT